MPRKDKESELMNLSVDEIRQMKKDVEEFLKHLEDEHKSKSISDESYKEAKEKNEKKLQEINDLLKKWGIIEDEQAEPEAEKPAETEEPAHEPKPDGTAAPAEEPVAQETDGGTGGAAGSMQLEIMQSKINTEIEKVKAFVDAIKETNASMDERIQKLTESVGELRSMVFQREGASRDLEMKIEKIEDVLSDIKPEKYAKELEKRDRISAEQEMKIEKIERKTEDMLKIMNGIRATLESIGGLENIAAVNRSIAEKKKEIDKQLSEIKKLSGKIEKMYVEMNKNLEEFVLYKSKQDSMDELTGELTKAVDTITVGLGNYVTKKSFEKLKTDIIGLQNNINEIKKIMSTLIPIAQLKIPEPIKKLRDESESIKTIISTLDDELKEKKITKNEYEKIIKKNREKLAEIEEKLKNEWNNFLKSLKIKSEAEPRSAETAAEKPEHETVKKAIPEQREAAQKDTEKKQQKETGKTKQELQEAEQPKTMKPMKPVAPETEKAETKHEKTVPKEKPTADAVKAPEKKETGKKEVSVESGKADKESLLADLEESFKNGLISKEAFERTKKMLDGYEK